MCVFLFLLVFVMVSERQRFCFVFHSCLFFFPFALGGMFLASTFRTHSNTSVFREMRKPPQRDFRKRGSHSCVLHSGLTRLGKWGTCGVSQFSSYRSNPLPFPSPPPSPPLPPPPTTHTHTSSTHSHPSLRSKGS